MSISLVGNSLLRNLGKSQWPSSSSSSLVAAALESYNHHHHHHHHHHQQTHQHHPYSVTNASVVNNSFRYYHTTHPVNSRRRGITRPPQPPPPPSKGAPSSASASPPSRLHLVQQCKSLHNGSGWLRQSAPDARSAAILGNSAGELRMDPFKLVQHDLDNLFTNIRQELSSTKLSELREVASYYFDGQGKALRPLIIILLARAMNAHLRGNSELLNSQKNVSLIIEMVHTASLIHDDVIDSADTRRGKPSVNSLYGMKKSVIAGDFVISRSSQMLARLNDARVISTLSAAIVDLVLGEFMQMGNKEGVDERFAHYIEKTFMKTASLIAYTCNAVTYLAGADEKLQQAAFMFGRNLGIAFQLVDDLLDFVSNQTELGKPAAADLKLGLATAPVLFACQKFPELNELIIRRFSQPGDAEKAYDAVMKSDSIHQTRMLAQKHADEAASYIAQLIDSPEKEGLMVLCDMVLTRKK